MNSLRIVVIVIGILFLLPGLSAVLRPEDFAQALGLVAVPPVGLATISVLIGAPYLAMSAITLTAAIRRHWILLVPIASIEGAMAVVRVFAALRDGLGPNVPAAVVPIFIEAAICIVLALGVSLSRRRGA